MGNPGQKPKRVSKTFSRTYTLAEWKEMAPLILPILHEVFMRMEVKKERARHEKNEIKPTQFE